MLRIGHGPQLDQVPLPSPDAVSVVEPEPWTAVFQRNLADCPIMFWIGPVYVAADTPAEQGMVEPSVEFHLVLPDIGFDDYPPKVVLPSIDSPSLGFIER